MIRASYDSCPDAELGKTRGSLGVLGGHKHTSSASLVHRLRNVDSGTWTRVMNYDLLSLPRPTPS